MSKKQRLSFTVEQRRDYAKLMVEEGYTYKQVMDISGAGQTAVSRWKKQSHIDEIHGKTPQGTQWQLSNKKSKGWKKNMAKRDNEILKKAAAIFVRKD